MRLLILASLFQLITSNEKDLSKVSCYEESGRMEQHLRQKRETSLTLKEHLDQEIDYLLGTLPDLIDKAVDVTTRAEAFVFIKRVTQGLSIIVGSWKEIYGDFLANNRSLGNLGGMGTIWKYGFYGFFGVGFGSPLLFSLPDVDLGCDSRDFLTLLQTYGLSNGLYDLIDAGLNGSSINSIVGEFDLLVRVELACILDFEGEQRLAEEILFALDELNAAMTARITVIFEEEAEQQEQEDNDPGSSQNSQEKNRRLLNEVSAIRNRRRRHSQKPSLKLKKIPLKNRRKGHDRSEVLTNFSF